MIQTADTDYAADYDTDYEKPIKSRCFDKKSPKIVIGPLKLKKLNFLYDNRYRRCRLFSPVQITTDTSNNRPNHEYYRCIGNSSII